MEFKDIYLKYGPQVWRIAKRYDVGFGIWDADDLYQQTLIHLYAGFDSGVIGDNEKIVTSYIISCIIDILRVERYREMLSLDSMQQRQKERAEPVSIRTYEQYKAEVENLKTSLAEKLPEIIFETIWEIMFPREETVQRAIIENLEASKDKTRLRMNVRKAKVTGKHVRDTLGISKATLSRRLQQAREILGGYYYEEENQA